MSAPAHHPEHDHGTTAPAVDAAVAPSVGLPHHVADEHAGPGVVAVPVIPDPETPDTHAAADLFPRRPEPVVAAAIRAAQARYGLTTSLEALDRIAGDWLGVHGTGA